MLTRLWPTASLCASLCAVITPAIAKDNLFYDSDKKSLESQILPAVMSGCNKSFLLINAQIKLDCKTERCKGEAIVKSSNVHGSVFMTPDFHFLFPRPADDVDSPDESYVHDGIVDLTIKRSYVSNEQAINDRNACFADIGQKLVNLLAGPIPSDFARMSKQNGNKTEAKAGTMELGFGRITFSYPARIDVRQDAVVGVEFVPSQRFTIAAGAPTDEDIKLFVRSMEKAARAGSRKPSIEVNFKGAGETGKSKGETTGWSVSASAQDGVVSAQIEVCAANASTVAGLTARSVPCFAYR
ncbi:hypothetical protein [Caballeronia sp. GaOx3]|uniref:hypothetical protein n=1 Tax=Caballeronia sp. GaOx3 TaxID=2921740 RepID=UPI002027E53B|nr:hypothetical protein [Caballeronia sp. GaOx3]